MDAGAIGLGSSSNENHRGAGGIPIASRLADDREFRALAKVLSDYDHGVFMMTCGEHHGIPFMEELSRLSGKASFYAPLFHYAHQPQRASGIMRAAEAARARGVPVYAQGSCQPLSLSFTLDQAYILKAMSPWPRTEDHEALRRILSDPTFRDAFRQMLARPDSQHIFKGRWDWVPVALTVLPKNADLVGRTIAEIARERGADPLDVFLDLGLEEDFGTKFTLFMLNMDEEGVAELLINDGTLISLSDAGAHNAMLCDAGYAMYLLGHWGRERGLFDLPTAIRKVTSDPAGAYGIMDRGRLTPGAWADMMLFDPDRITVTNMERHFDLPAGGERLLRRAPGLHGTWVNGVRVFDGENYLSVSAPGHVLTRFSGARPKLGMPPCG
jgi:N-acyl-D-amino-acid deacylase